MTAKKKNKKIPVLLFIFFMLALLCIIPIHQLLKYKNTPPKNEQLIHTTTTRWSPEFIFGEIDKTMFPVVTNPKYYAFDQADTILEDSDVVYFFEKNGTTYIYPAIILSYHHVVNDSIESEPIAMTLCLLSGSAAVYERTVEAQVLEFGVLGTLYNGNLLMYDTSTDSQWLQLNGEAIEGYYTHSRLKTYAPVLKSTWGAIKSQPNIAVLPPIREMKFYRDFYNSFLKSPFGIESLGERKPNPLYDPFTIGIGIEVQNESAFYRLDDIKKKKIIQDVVGGFPIVAIYNASLDSSSIYLRSAGNQILDFEFKNNILIDKNTHTQWNLNGQAEEGELKDQRLQSPIFTEVYWFSWSSFYPNTKIF